MPGRFGLNPTTLENSQDMVGVEFGLVSSLGGTYNQLQQTYTRIQSRLDGSSRNRNKGWTANLCIVSIEVDVREGNPSHFRGSRFWIRAPDPGILADQCLLFFANADLVATQRGRRTVCVFFDAPRPHSSHINYWKFWRFSECLTETRSGPRRARGRAVLTGIASYEWRISSATYSASCLRATIAMSPRLIAQQM